MMPKDFELIFPENYDYNRENRDNWKIDSVKREAEQNLEVMKVTILLWRASKSMTYVNNSENRHGMD